MKATTDKLLLDVISELQQIRTLLAAVAPQLLNNKVECVLTVKATPRKRRKRRPGPRQANGLPLAGL